MTRCWQRAVQIESMIQLTISEAQKSLGLMNEKRGNEGKRNKVVEIPKH